MKRYVHFPKVEGQASRQAHADLPAGTYEREISKEGFFGPAAHLYHRHPPTGWVNFEGPLRPHAFDCTKLARSQEMPWGAPELLHNAAVRVRFWRCDGEHAGAGAQCRRRRADVRARRARRVLLRLRTSLLRGRRLHPDSARHHVARGVRRTAACAAHRGHQQLLPAAGQGTGGPARHLRCRHARHAAHRRRIPAISRTAANGASRSNAATKFRP